MSAQHSSHVTVAHRPKFFPAVVMHLNGADCLILKLAYLFESIVVVYCPAHDSRKEFIKGQPFFFIPLGRFFAYFYAYYYCLKIRIVLVLIMLDI